MQGQRGTDGSLAATFAPLSFRLYRRIWLAFLVSSLGTFLQLTAGPWLMHVLTGSPLMVSLVTTALLLPHLLLTLVAGALSDVFDRRSLVLFGQSVSCVSVSIMAFLAHLEALGPWMLLGLTFALGVGQAIGLPSFLTLVPDLVPPALLAQAITLNSAALNVARALGPSLGGILVAIGLTQAAFGINAVSFLAIIGVMLTLGGRPPEDMTRRRFWRSTALGLRYARFTRPIRSLLVVAALFAFASANVQALLPSLASQELGLDAGGFGILFGLFGLGALLGAATREMARIRTGRHMLPGSIIGLGVAGVGLGIAPGPFITGGVLIVVGMCWVWTLTTLNASVQTLAPRWVRGRVVSIFILAIGIQPLGAFVAGALAEAIGVGAAVAMMNAGCLALGLALLRFDLPVLGDLEEPMPAHENWSPPRHDSAVDGTPIVVATTWEIRDETWVEFVDLMREMRRLRLRTGATRWALFREVDRPSVATEMFSVPDWEEHLAQHSRIDVDAAHLLARARDLDINGAPKTRHFAGMDIDGRSPSPMRPTDIAIHDALHRSDGSLPLTHELGDQDVRGSHSS